MAWALPGPSQSVRPGSPSDTSKTPPNADGIEVSDSLTLRKPGGGHVKGQNGHAAPSGLSDRTVDEAAVWAKEWRYRHRDEPGVNGLLMTALHERLRNTYDIFPEHLDTEAARVIERMFEV